jgi:hypothetical protein
MPISVVCPQGHKLKAKEALAGKRVKCPQCRSWVEIPALDVSAADASVDRVEPGSMDTVNDKSGLFAAVNAGPEAYLPVEDQLPTLEDLGSSVDDQLPALDEFDPLDENQSTPLDDLDPLADIAAVEAAVQPAPSTGSGGTTAKPSEALAGLSKTTVLAFAGAGAAFGLLCVAVFGWWLFGGQDPPTPVAVDREVAAAPAAPAARAEPAPETSTPREETPPTEPVVSEPAPTEPEPESKIPASDPFGLAPIELDERLDGFRLPGTTWAAAYDEVTGRLAVTNDDQGILIYNIDQLAEGDRAPEAVLPTDGLPTAVCLKPLSDRRVFVVAGQDQAAVRLIDADSLQPLADIPLANLKYVDFLTGSTNPQDPFVYYTTQRYQRVEPGSGEQDFNDTADRLGCINLVTREQTEHSHERFSDVAVSGDGQRLYARPASTADGVCGSWDALVSLQGHGPRAGVGRWSRNYTPAPVCPLGNVVAVHVNIHTPSMQLLVARTRFSPGARFRSRPVLVGLGPSGIVFGSANDYRELASVPLPADWLRTDRKADPDDFRLRPDLSPTIRSAFQDVAVDDARGAALVIFGDHLVIASLDRAQVPAEPPLFVRTSLPEKVTLGEPLEVDIELVSGAEQATIEYVPNTDWLPDEQQPVLGLLPPGQVSPRPLELRVGLGADDPHVMLKDFSPLRDRQLPFKLRVGNEVMLVTEFAFPKLMVQRTHPVLHGFSERIAVVDDAGNDLTAPAEPAAPPGKPLPLAAAISEQQSVVILRDLDAVAGLPLPLEIQIGEEKMLVTAVDDFRSMLTVQRTEPASHSVTSEAFLLSKTEIDAGDTGAESRPNLPTVSGRTFRWTPGFDQLGTHNIRMRARLGDLTHEWFWTVTVERSASELPFQVVGIEPIAGPNYAVVWGQAALPAGSTGSRAGSSQEAGPYFVGIYSTATQQLTRHAEVPAPVLAAALHETGVYAVVGPKRLVRLDVRTLQVVNEVELDTDCNRLQIIAGRFLAAFEPSGRGSVRFAIPDLTPVEPGPIEYGHPVEGRLRDGWVWEGIVWDDQLKQPQLMLFPVPFESPRRLQGRSEPQVIAALGGVILLRTQGCYACTWCPLNQPLGGHYRVTSVPAALSVTNGQLEFYSWAAPSRPRVGRDPVPTSSLKLVEMSRSAVAGRPRPVPPPAYVSEANGQVHVALLGRVYTVPLDRLAQEEDSFRFVERQDRFVLEAGRPAKLSYAAPGAARYHLQLWRQRPSFHDEAPTVAAESTDGTFELSLDEVDYYALSALEMAGADASRQTPQEVMRQIQEYLDGIEPAYRRLTGTKPRGVPVPIYISVVADHQDGQQKAGLAHSYLVEVPLRTLQQYASRTR